MVSTTGRAAVTTLFILTAILAGCSTGGDSAEPADTDRIDAPTDSDSDTGSDPGPGSGSDDGSGAGVDAIEVVDIGFSTYEEFDDVMVSAGAILRNTGSEDAHLIAITFTFQGEGDGEIVGVHENQVTTIPAGGEMYTGVYDVELDGEPTAVETELRLVGEGVDWGRAFAAPLTIDSLEPHEWSDGMLIEGTFTNGTDDTLELLEVICILRNGDTIVGSGFSVIEPVEPGGSEPWDVLTQVAASSADCLTAQQV